MSILTKPSDKNTTYNNYFILPPKYDNQIFTDKKLKFFNKTIVRLSVSKIKYNWSEPYLSKTQNSTGTGFFIDLNGFILTCYHVVENAYKINITLPNIDNNDYEADIISIYPERDIALLKIKDYINKDYLVCGDSEIINQSSNIIAVGYMLGSKQLKITTGTVNGLTDNNIQMDAIINPGNSGGPLFNLKFEVIGINASKNVGKNIEGVNFAIPIKQYLINKECMINNKIIKSPKLGCVFSFISKDYLKKYNVDMEKYDNIGIIITNILENSPAFNNIKMFDIIIEFNNHKIDSKGMTNIDKIIDKVQIDYLIYNLSIKDKVPIKLLSLDNNKYIEKDIIIDFTYNNFLKIDYKYPPFDNIDYIVICGLVLMDLSFYHVKNTDNYNLYKYYNINNRNINRVIITKIINGSIVDNLNIIEEDTIIKSINEHLIYTIVDVYDILKIIKNNNEEYIKIITEDNDIFTMNIMDMLKEDKILSEYNGYLSNVNKLWFSN